MLALEAVSSLSGIAVAVIAGATAVMVARINTKVNTVRSDTQQVNRAVNHVGENEPTLIQRVNVLGDQVRLDRQWQQYALRTVASQVGVELVSPPPELQAQRNESHA